MHAEPHTSRRPVTVAELIARLADTTDDGELEAMCRALVALDVMRPCANHAFAFRPRHLLAPEVVQVITELGAAVPLRYLIAPQI